jgi:hypothetical protein
LGAGSAVQPRTPFHIRGTDFNPLIMKVVSLLALAVATDAFVPSHRKTTVLSARAVGKPIRAATVDGTTTSSSLKPNGSQEPTSWDCNDEAECVVVPACDEEQCRTSLDVRIHGEWYDLTGEWQFLAFVSSRVGHRLSISLNEEYLR